MHLLCCFGPGPKGRSRQQAQKSGLAPAAFPVPADSSSRSRTVSNNTNGELTNLSQYPTVAAQQLLHSRSAVAEEAPCPAATFILQLDEEQLEYVTAGVSQSSSRVEQSIVCTSTGKVFLAGYGLEAQFEGIYYCLECVQLSDFERTAVGSRVQFVAALVDACSRDALLAHALASLVQVLAGPLGPMRSMLVESSSPVSPQLATTVRLRTQYLQGGSSAAPTPRLPARSPTHKALMRRLLVVEFPVRTAPEGADSCPGGSSLAVRSPGGPGGPSGVVPPPWKLQLPSPASSLSPMQMQSRLASAMASALGGSMSAAGADGQPGGMVSGSTSGVRGGAMDPGLSNAIKRAYLMMSEVPALLTLVTREGIVLAQNTLSIQYFGNIEGVDINKHSPRTPMSPNDFTSAALAAAAVSGGLRTGLLPELFALEEPDMLEEMLEDCMTLGREWKRVLRVPTSLVPQQPRLSLPGAQPAPPPLPAALATGSGSVGASLSTTNNNELITVRPASGPTPSVLSRASFQLTLHESDSHTHTYDEALLAAAAAGGLLPHSSGGPSPLATTATDGSGGYGLAPPQLLRSATQSAGGGDNTPSAGGSVAGVHALGVVDLVAAAAGLPVGELGAGGSGSGPGPAAGGPFHRGSISFSGHQVLLDRISAGYPPAGPSAPQFARMSFPRDNSTKDLHSMPQGAGSSPQQHQQQQAGAGPDSPRRSSAPLLPSPRAFVRRTATDSEVLTGSGASGAASGAASAAPAAGPGEEQLLIGPPSASGWLGSTNSFTGAGTDSGTGASGAAPSTAPRPARGQRPSSQPQSTSSGGRGEQQYPHVMSGPVRPASAAPTVSPPRAVTTDIHEIHGLLSQGTSSASLTMARISNGSSTPQGYGGLGPGGSPLHTLERSVSMHGLGVVMGPRNSMIEGLGEEDNSASNLGSSYSLAGPVSSTGMPASSLASMGMLTRKHSFSTLYSLTGGTGSPSMSQQAGVTRSHSVRRGSSTQLIVSSERTRLAALLAATSSTSVHSHHNNHGHMHIPPVTTPTSQINLLSGSLTPAGHAHHSQSEQPPLAHPDLSHPPTPSTTTPTPTPPVYSRNNSNASEAAGASRRNTGSQQATMGATGSGGSFNSATAVGRGQPLAGCSSAEPLTTVACASDSNGGSSTPAAPSFAAVVAAISGSRSATGSPRAGATPSGATLQPDGPALAWKPPSRERLSFDYTPHRGSPSHLLSPAPSHTPPVVGARLSTDNMPAPGPQTHPANRSHPHGSERNSGAHVTSRSLQLAMLSQPGAMEAAAQQHMAHQPPKRVMSLIVSATSSRSSSPGPIHPSTTTGTAATVSVSAPVPARPAVGPFAASSVQELPPFAPAQRVGGGSPAPGGPFASASFHHLSLPTLPESQPTSPDGSATPGSLLLGTGGTRAEYHEALISPRGMRKSMSANREADEAMSRAASSIASLSSQMHGDRSSLTELACGGSGHGTLECVAESLVAESPATAAASSEAGSAPELRPRRSRDHATPLPAVPMASNTAGDAPCVAPAIDLDPHQQHDANVPAVASPSRATLILPPLQLANDFDTGGPEAGPLSRVTEEHAELESGADAAIAAMEDEAEGDDEEVNRDLEEFVPFCYHEVEVKPVLDPVTAEPALLLMQRDVTERAQLENTLSELTEAQLAMLSQIFPRHVIEALSVAGGAEAISVETVARLARSHNDVTILFMDIVGFTAMSKDVSAEEVITFLNLLFSRYDKLVEYHQVTKLEMLGDCFIVAAGVLAPDAEGFRTVVEEGHDPQDSARRVFAFAQDMLRVSLPVKMPTGVPVSLRVGLHTGPCVSGLVGIGLPKYSVFGDTVNTAARLEQTCPPNHIQVSEQTRSLLAEEEPLEPTGGVAIKGKGVLETYIWSPPPEWSDQREAGQELLLTPADAPAPGSGGKGRQTGSRMEALAAAAQQQQREREQSTGAKLISREAPAVLPAASPRLPAAAVADAAAAAGEPSQMDAAYEDAAVAAAVAADAAATDGRQAAPQLPPALTPLDAAGAAAASGRWQRPGIINVVMETVVEEEQSPANTTTLPMPPSPVAQQQQGLAAAAAGPRQQPAESGGAAAAPAGGVRRSALRVSWAQVLESDHSAPGSAAAAAGSSSRSGSAEQPVAAVRKSVRWSAPDSRESSAHGGNVYVAAGAADPAAPAAPAAAAAAEEAAEEAEQVRTSPETFIPLGITATSPPSGNRAASFSGLQAPGAVAPPGAAADAAEGARSSVTRTSATGYGLGPRSRPAGSWAYYSNSSSSGAAAAAAGLPPAGAAGQAAGAAGGIGPPSGGRYRRVSMALAHNLGSGAGGAGTSGANAVGQVSKEGFLVDEMGETEGHFSSIFGPSRYDRAFLTLLQSVRSSVNDDTHAAAFAPGGANATGGGLGNTSETAASRGFSLLIPPTPHAPSVGRLGPTTPGGPGGRVPATPAGRHSRKSYADYRTFIPPPTPHLLQQQQQQHQQPAASANSSSGGGAPAAAGYVAPARRLPAAGGSGGVLLMERPGSAGVPGSSSSSLMQSVGSGFGASRAGSMPQAMPWLYTATSSSTGAADSAVGAANSGSGRRPGSAGTSSDISSSAVVAAPAAPSGEPGLGAGAGAAAVADRLSAAVARAAAAAAATSSRGSRPSSGLRPCLSATSSGAPPPTSAELRLHMALSSGSSIGTAAAAPGGAYSDLMDSGSAAGGITSAPHSGPGGAGSGSGSGAASAGQAPAQPTQQQQQDVHAAGFSRSSSNNRTSRPSVSRSRSFSHIVARQRGVSRTNSQANLQPQVHPGQQQPQQQHGSNLAPKELASAALAVTTSALSFGLSSASSSFTTSNHQLHPLLASIGGQLQQQLMRTSSSSHGQGQQGQAQQGQMQGGSAPLQAQQHQGQRRAEEEEDDDEP